MGVIRIALLLATLLPASAAAADWELISTSDKAILFIDKTSIVTTRGGVRKAWFMWDYIEQQDAKNYPAKKFLSSKVLNHFNCTERTMGAVQSVLYEKGSGNGETVESSSMDPAKVPMVDPVPDTLGEAMFNRVCTTAQQQVPTKAPTKMPVK